MAKEQRRGPGCGGLYNGQVLPWINMTIKAALWYMLCLIFYHCLLYFLMTDKLISSCMHI